MATKKQGIDVIDKVLEACYAADKDGLFIMSLMHQYEDRGFLTKKQLQGLHSKASKHKNVQSGWLATLEAMIAKLPNRDKTPLEKVSTPAIVDDNTPVLLNAILAKYPRHKAVLALQFRFQQNKQLTVSESAELKKLYNLLAK